MSTDPLAPLRPFLELHAAASTRLDGALVAHPRGAAQAAIFLVEEARVPARAAALAALPASLFDGAVVDRLAATAAALLAQASPAVVAVTVRPETLAHAEAIKARLQKLLEYHLADDPQASAELAEIRTGSGPLDLASDLSRYASLCGAHEALLGGDRNFRPEDVPEARIAAGEIVADLQAIAAANGEGDRRLLLALLAADYAEVLAALVFVGRREPKEAQAKWVPLRAALQKNDRLPFGLGAVHGLGAMPLVVDVTPTT